MIVVDGHKVYVDEFDRYIRGHPDEFDTWAGRRHWIGRLNADPELWSDFCKSLGPGFRSAYLATVERTARNIIAARSIVAPANATDQ